MYSTADLNNNMRPAVAFFLLVNIQFNTGEKNYFLVFCQGHIDKRKQSMSLSCMSAFGSSDPSG